MTNLRFFFLSIGILFIILAFTCDMSQHGQTLSQHGQTLSLGVGINLVIFGGMLYLCHLINGWRSAFSMACAASRYKASIFATITLKV